MDNKKILTEEQIENVDGGVGLRTSPRPGPCPKCGSGGMYRKEFGTDSKGGYLVWACHNCGETIKVYPTPLKDKFG